MLDVPSKRCKMDGWPCNIIAMWKSCPVAISAQVRHHLTGTDLCCSDGGGDIVFRSSLTIKWTTRLTSLRRYDATSTHLSILGLSQPVRSQPERTYTHIYSFILKVEAQGRLHIGCFRQHLRRQRNLDLKCGICQLIAFIDARIMMSLRLQMLMCISR